MPSDRSTENAEDPDVPLFGAEDLNHHQSFLHWASYYGSPKVTKLLLSRGGANLTHVGNVSAYFPPVLEDMGKWMKPINYITGSERYAPATHSITDIADDVGNHQAQSSAALSSPSQQLSCRSPRYCNY